MRLAILVFILSLARVSYGLPVMVTDTIPFDTDSSFDVNYMKLDLFVRPDTEYIAGNVELLSHANILRGDRTIQLSLREQLQVDTITENGSPATFSHIGDKLFVTLSRIYAPGERFILKVYYHGFSTTPDRRGFIHTTQLMPAPGNFTSWSSSEPFNAKDWIPCKDNPADKLDSADLIFTCPKPNNISSNGILTRVVEHDTTTTFYWHESYPIDHYLLAFQCTIADTISHWHHWADGDSTYIMHWVYPVSMDTMPDRLKIIDTILDLYDRWFGPYPFRHEKYGFAQWEGGGMENQTLSFCNSADPGLVAHETAHQWFGDAITCKTWNDCWLNEGFATYIADEYNGYFRHLVSFDTIMKGHERDVTSQPGGTVHTPDSLLVPNTLNGRLVYSKAALLLHMLNFILGSDSAFFRCIREYITGPLRYHVASAEDFRAAVEKASGRDLKWFFNEWVYGDGYPIYSVTWAAKDSLHPVVAISERGSTEYSPFFTMPIELEFKGVGIDTIVQVWDDQALKAFQFSFSKPVQVMVFDPHNWLLDGEEPRTLAVRISQSQAMPFTVSKEVSGYDFMFSTSSAGDTHIAIYDMLGREVCIIPLGMLDEGAHSIPYQFPALINGMYICQLFVNDRATASSRFIVTQ